LYDAGYTNGLINQLVENPLFSTNTNRVKNRKELFKLLESKISDFTSNDLIQQFIKNDVPAGIIKSVKEVFEQTENEALILTDENGKRVKTTAFDIQF